MPTRDQLLALVHELRGLSIQATQRGDLRLGEPMPGYWYGIMAGYEGAVQKLEADERPARGSP